MTTLINSPGLKPPTPASELPPWERGAQITQGVSKSVKTLAGLIFEKIVSDSYSYGTRLPAERRLAEEFSVSRNTVRQALDLLEAHQVISRRAGSGSFVTYRSDGPRAFADAEPGDGHMASSPEIAALSARLLEIAEITGPLELNVVRSIVEPEMVRLAVINMSARDIAKLKDCLGGLESVTTSAEDFSHWDLEFHLQIARGARNPLLFGIYEVIHHVRRHAHWAKTKEKTLSPSRIREYQAKHRSIYEAIEARDIESAVEFSKLHMTEVQRDLIRDD
ncbi:MAG: FadR/GntR family transcriptional regulator [Kiloniellales bacterium]|nr:FadR/GntR family transcriptional regulator [Kiloniellales bacterium]